MMRAGEVAVPLQGRERELDELVRHLRPAARGQLRLAVVQGEPGIGKTRLLHEAELRLARQGFAVRGGRGEELAKLRPLGLVIDALGMDVSAVGPAGEPPDALRYRLLQLAIDKLEETSQECPLLLVLDDLQWADAASLLFLRALAGRVTGRPIAVIGAFRPVPRDPDFSDSVASVLEAGALRVALEPLAQDAVRRLAEAVLEAPVGASVLRWAQGAGGNPLYVTELLRSGKEAGAVEVVDDEAVLTREPLPRALSILLERRVSALAPETADVLKVAAVLGDRVLPRVLSELMGRSSATVLPALEEAVEMGLLFSDGSRLVFRHDLVRDAVYRRIPTALRASMHLDAARALSEADAPAGVVAAHLLRAAEEPAAVPMLRDAAQRLASSDPGSAADLLDRALEIMPAAHPDRTATSVALVRLLAWAGRPEEAAARAELVLSAGLDAETEARLRVGLAEAMIFRGLPLGVLEQLERARRLPRLSDKELAPLLAAAAHARLFAGGLEAVEECVRDAVAAADRVGDHASACFALVALMIRLRSRGRLEDSLRAGREAVARAESGGREAGQRHPRLFLAPTLFSLGSIEEAEDAYRSGRALAEELGSVWSLPPWAAFRAIMLRALGRWDEAVAEAEAAVQLGEELGIPNVTPMACAVLADIAAHRNDFVTARRYVERGETLLRRGVSWTVQFFAWGAASMHDAAGDRAGSAARLIDAGVDGGALDLLVAEHGPGPQMVRILLLAGERARAERISAVAESFADMNPSVAALRAGALHCQGLVQGDRELLAEAASGFASTPFVPAWAAACEDAGHAAADTDRGRAVELLDQARELQTELGAALDVARIDSRLRELGVRRRSRTRVTGHGGLQSLTSTEMRVAGLVADGLSNPEIAKRLFISRHTVESHLKHIFIKLGIGSRVELATMAVRNQDDQAALSARP